MPTVRNKLTKYRSEYFTPGETIDYISEVILEIDALLKNPILKQAYTEEFGLYKGLSRIVIKKFWVYFKKNADDIIILAILFPGEK